MPLFRGTRLPLILGGRRYIDKVLSYGPLALWPQREPSGTVSEELVSGWNGAYTGVTLGQPGIGDGNTCPFFDGTNDLNNIYTAELSAAFSGSEGALMVWAWVNAVGIWSDATRRLVARLYANTSHEVFIGRRTGAGDVPANDRLYFSREAGGTRETFAQTTASVDWMCCLLTWSEAANNVEAFFNGVSVGTAAATAWTATTLNSANTTIGAVNNVPNYVWHGWLGPGAIWARALSTAEALDLATL